MTLDTVLLKYIVNHKNTLVYTCTNSGLPTEESCWSLLATGTATPQAMLVLAASDWAAVSAAAVTRSRATRLPAGV